MSVFGLDIGSTSTKIIQLEKAGDRFRVVTVGIAPTAQSGFGSESESDLVKLAAALKKLHQDARVTTKRVVTALPEGQVFTRVIEMPQMSENEASQAILWEAEQFIPRPLSEVEIDWQIVSPGGVMADKKVEQMKVLLVAAPKVLIQKYLKVLGMAGFEIAALETEVVALARALIPSSAAPTLLVDFGAQTTDMAIIAKGQVLLTRSIPTAGEAFTRAVSTALSLEPSQAEEYKRAYGLGENKLEGKVRQALTPILEVAATEIKKAFQFWKEREKEAVRSVILSGGSANLPEVSTYLTRSIGIEVQIADPFSSLDVSEKMTSAFKGQTPVFAIAVGLAEKEV